MKAMVLAAGFGNRLQPLTSILPKPMFPVLGRPLLSHTFDILKSANITDIAVNVHHLPDYIIDYYENEKPPDLNLYFSREEKILGTAGGIKKMENFLKDDPFILINSDIISDINLNKVIDFHKVNNSKLTLVVRQDISYFPSLREYKTLYGLSKPMLDKINKDIIVMHPGPINRGVEITSEVADSSNSIILDQVENGVAIRMAIIYLLASKINRI